MARVKAVVTALIYFGSCAALLATHVIGSTLHVIYASDLPVSPEERTFLFTSIALSLIPNTALICFGTIGLSALLAVFATRRLNPQESKLYWVTVLGALNYYISLFVLGTLLIGLFLLPKLANGT